MNEVKDFNYKNIYQCSRLESFKGYAKLILETIIKTLEREYMGTETLDNLYKLKDIYPELYKTFSSWLIKYSINYKNTNKNKDKKYKLRK